MSPTTLVLAIAVVAVVAIAWAYFGRNKFANNGFLFYQTVDGLPGVTIDSQYQAKNNRYHAHVTSGTFTGWFTFTPSSSKLTATSNGVEHERKLKNAGDSEGIHAFFASINAEESAVLPTEHADAATDDPASEPRRRRWSRSTQEPSDGGVDSLLDPAAGDESTAHVMPAGSSAGPSTTSD